MIVETEVLGDKCIYCHKSTTNLIWAGLESNLGHRGERLAIKNLNCDKTLNVQIFTWVINKHPVRTAQ
jgi:hypothetical protein